MSYETPLQRKGESVEIVLPGLSSPVMLGGEAIEDFEMLRSGYLQELRPRTPYLRSLAEDLVRYEWEMTRFRRLRDACVLKAYRTLALNVLAHGTIGPKPTAAEPDQSVVDWANELVSADPAKRKAAEQDFDEETKFSCSDILRRAIASNPEFDTFEKRICDLELRRRRVREQFEKLSKQAPQMIEDAEIVEETK